MTRVLFVCTANQCRSPIAERLLRARLAEAAPGAGAGPDDVVVASAGLAAAPGRPMVADSAAALRELGGDDTGFASQAVSADVLDDADLVLTMTAAHREELLGRFPRLLRRTFTLAEAAGLADEAMELAEPDGVAEALAVARARQAGGPIHHADVPDPVGRPAEVHRQVAAQIAAYLDALLPLLGGSGPFR